MSALNGTWTLARLILRRDRWRMAAWMLVALGITLATAAGMGAAYPTDAARAAFAGHVMADPAQLALIGPVFDPSVGGLTAWRVRGWGVIRMGLVALFTVVRHTRRDEELGRSELVGATGVGRLAPLAAVLGVLVGAFGLTALLVAGGLVAIGLPAGGALALGAGYMLNGLVFAGLAAVTAQVAGSSRGASGLAGAALGLLFALRGVVDATHADALAWLSPANWAEAMRPFAGERWMPALPAVGLAAGLAAVAFWLASRRDLGAGLLPAREGPARAGAGLRGAVSLAWRLQRGSLIAWSLGSLVVGLALGGVARTAGAQIHASAPLAAMVRSLGGGDDPVNGFWAVALYLAAQVYAGYAIHTALKPGRDEASGHAELLLAGPVSRPRWALGPASVAVLAPALFLGLLGVGMGGLPLAAAALVRLPAVWVLGGIGLLGVGLARRAGALGWVALAIFFSLELEGVRHLFGDGALQLSPFVHIPALPAAPFAWAPLLALSAIALALYAAGLALLARRDVG